MLNLQRLTNVQDFELLMYVPAAVISTQRGVSEKLYDSSYRRASTSEITGTALIAIMLRRFQTFKHVSTCPKLAHTDMQSCTYIFWALSYPKLVIPRFCIKEQFREQNDLSI